MRADSERCGGRPDQVHVRDCCVVPNPSRIALGSASASMHRLLKIVELYGVCVSVCVSRLTIGCRGTPGSARPVGHFVGASVGSRVEIYAPSRLYAHPPHVGSRQPKLICPIYPFFPPSCDVDPFVRKSSCLTHTRRTVQPCSATDRYPPIDDADILDNATGLVNATEDLVLVSK